MNKIFEFATLVKRSGEPATFFNATFPGQVIHFENDDLVSILVSLSTLGWEIKSVDNQTIGSGSILFQREIIEDVHPSTKLLAMLQEELKAQIENNDRLQEIPTLTEYERAFNEGSRRSLDLVQLWLKKRI